MPSSSTATSNMAALPSLLGASMVATDQSHYRIPYDPTKRITAPGSVLVPWTRSELEQSQKSSNPLRKAASISTISGYSEKAEIASRNGNGSLKISKSAQNNQFGESKLSRLDNIVANQKGAVANHYNARPNIDQQARLLSPIIGLKYFNNWVKSVLIDKYARQQDPEDPGRRKRLKVLELGCGKGGDLMKWLKVNTGSYYGLDIAAVSVEQARSRWKNIRDRNKFSACFIQADCFETDISEILQPGQRNPLFDAVSMQFCMHYAFETSAKARQMLSNVCRYLRPGGVFLGTIPNSEILMEKLSEVPVDEPELAFGNSVYRIKFDDRDWVEPFGHRYTFFLQDAIEEVPEYVVHWDAFVDLAREFDLHVIFKSDFQNLFIEAKETPEYRDLLRKMKVIDARGDTVMTADQLEAATLYVAFALTKVGEKESQLFQ